MKYRDNEPKVDAGLAASLKALREIPLPFAKGNYDFVHTFGHPTGVVTGKAVPLFAELPGDVINTAEVIQLDAHRPDPHIVLIAPGKAHVIPVSLITDVVEGNTDALMHMGSELLRDILRDWLTQVQADKDDGK